MGGLYNRECDATPEDYRYSREYKMWVESFGLELAEQLLKQYVARCKKAKEKAKNTKRIHSEEHYVQEILAYLKTVSHFVWRNWTTGLVGTDRVTSNPTKGIPDIMGILKDPNSTFYALEVKRPPFRVPGPSYDSKGLPSGKFAHYVSQNRWIEGLKTDRTVTGFVDGVDKVKALLEPFLVDNVTDEVLEPPVA